MNDQQRQMEYANDQHELACIKLEISTKHDDSGDTLFEAVVALMKDRDEWKEEAELREKKSDVLQHEVETLRAELKKSDEALEANITTFIDLREDRDEARGIAKESCSMLAENGFETNYPPMPWEDADPGLDSENR